LPRGHRSHVADDASQYMPLSQLVQTEAAFPENLSVPQPVHMYSKLAPTVSENLPAVQGVQTEAPVLSEYVPAVQSVQTEAPVLSENLPVPQAVHGPNTLHAAVKPV
jgi:hypothetical protein